LLPEAASAAPGAAGALGTPAELGALKNSPLAGATL
jgi:hypothetical protein